MNDNCLRDRMCPQCKQKDKFLIYTARWTSVTDDGTNDDDPVIDQLKMDRGLNFADEDNAICPPCGWFGRWEDTEIYPAETLYTQVCNEIGILPDDDGPLNRILDEAVESDDPVSIVEEEIQRLEQAVRFLVQESDKREREDGAG